ncbi:MAG: hypothetical protein QOG10_7200, partial [Kribbellaceae bacterium]|nr:hypothetical protein [Kribbellaceae bacterium]
MRTSTDRSSRPDAPAENDPVINAPVINAPVIMVVRYGERSQRGRVVA